MEYKTKQFDKVLFANIGWMVHYKGGTDKDIIVGGGNYFDENKHETFNFQNVNGKCFGYVQNVKGASINMARIGGKDFKSAEKIDGVLVVWIAKRPDVGGTYIVGWYNNATVYANYRSSNNSLRCKYAYNITARYSDCVLLPVDDRIMNVPRAKAEGKGFLGQSNVWYADSENPLVQTFRQKVIDYTKNFKAYTRQVSKLSVKVNVDERKNVEEAAVVFVTREFQRKGYIVTSREKENVGWDLDAENGKILLKLEVKGVSTDVVSVHITSNEYDNMMKDKKHYRLCVVVNAVRNPQMVVFVWDESLRQWVSEVDSTMILDIDMKPSYIASVK
ncbi:MAG: DUF3883 domain-containing protein [Bacteroidaceae bacterium]|nr:DUF3883 domain-containing protein [Bacteroidaceae bacterium]